MKRFLVALAVGGAVASGVFASAAALDITSTTLGAGTDEVESCDTAVSTAYTTAYNPTAKRFELASVTLSQVDSTACATKIATVDLAGETGASLGQLSWTVSGASKTWNTSAGGGLATGIDAASLTDIAVVING